MKYLLSIAITTVLFSCGKQITQEEIQSNLKKANEYSVSADSLNRISDSLVLKLKDNVTEKGSRPQDSLVLVDTKTAFETGLKLQRWLIDIQNELIQTAGGEKTKDGIVDLKNASGNQVVNDFFEETNGYGLEIQRRINGQAKVCNDISKKWWSGKIYYQEMALDGKNHPMYKMDKNKRRISFVQLHFQDKTVSEVLVELSLFQWMLSQQTADIVTKLYKEVGINTLID